ncbi:MAG: 30S ribosomal protein S8 [Alphaproteobacteria bacterium]|nr:MAG: 30S ribosomal protein S8 [Alphaproteobacteria bacterium]
MALIDPLSDMLTRIRNGQKAKQSAILCPASNLRKNVCEVMQREGYIRGFKLEEAEGKKQLKIELKYADGQPVIKEIRRVSRPGRRIYSGIKTLKPVYNGLGISILSTPKGVMSDIEARAANVGGEVLCCVF